MHIKGYSLLELLVTLALFAIILALALPNFKDFLNLNKSNNFIDNLYATLQFAKSAAITRQENIIFCSSADQKNCGSNWHDGQIVISANGTVLRVLPGLKNDENLTWQASLGKSENLQFLPDGTTAGQQGSFCFFDSAAPTYGRAIIINVNGRLRIAAGDEAKVVKCPG